MLSTLATREAPVAHPIFLSYSWKDLDEVDELDQLLRLRGVPVWRDRRDMRFGIYQEDRVRSAIREDCAGFVLYLTEAALTGASGFITDIELPAMVDRRNGEPGFVNGAVYRGYGFDEGQAAVHDRTGISLGGALGSRVTDDDTATGLREAANAILAGYLDAHIGDGPVPIHFDTRNDIRWSHPGLLHLGWNPPLQHDLAAPDPAIWSAELIPALHDLRCALLAATNTRELLLSGTPHVSAALALGFEYRRPTGWTLRMHDNYGGEWSTDFQTPDLRGWTATTEPGPSGSSDVLAVAVHARHDIAAAVRRHRSEAGVARATLHLRPPAGSPEESIDAASASALAAAIAGEIRNAKREYSTARTHLYFAGPWPMAALLGWHLASSGAITSYEATTDRQSYLTACDLV